MGNDSSSGTFWTDIVYRTESFSLPRKSEGGRRDDSFKKTAHDGQCRQSSAVECYGQVIKKYDFSETFTRHNRIAASPRKSSLRSFAKIGGTRPTNITLRAQTITHLTSAVFKSLQTRQSFCENTFPINIRVYICVCVWYKRSCVIGYIYIYIGHTQQNLFSVYQKTGKLPINTNNLSTHVFFGIFVYVCVRVYRKRRSKSLVN